MGVGLGLSLLDGESYRDAVARLAKQDGYDLREECLEEYDGQVALGVDEGVAAWRALYEWDCLPIVEV
jgi:hypothetical protein